jgi:hypothetical protein
MEMQMKNGTTAAAAAANQAANEWFNSFNSFERNFIRDAVAKIASQESDIYDVVSYEQRHIFDWIENSEIFQNFQYETPGLGVIEDLKLALGAFLSSILKSRNFETLVSIYLQD